MSTFNDLVKDLAAKGEEVVKELKKWHKGTKKTGPGTDPFVDIENGLRVHYEDPEAMRVEFLTVTKDDNGNVLWETIDKLVIHPDNLGRAIKSTDYEFKLNPIRR